MKKLKIGLFILFLLITTISAKNVYAASNNDMLISQGTGSYQITVNKSTTVDDIINVLGEPKLTTDSAFGGYAYTFYTDNNYNNYLYIETTSDGKIISYGSLEETYKTNTYSYGDSYPYNERSPLYGCLFSKEGIVGGGVYYNTSAVNSGNYSDVIELYENNYKSNPIKYLKGLSKQAILMYNALSFKLGNKDTTTLVYDEEFFYINEQFKELGTTIREYMLDMDLNTSYMKGIGVKSNVEIANKVYYIINPMLFADLAGNNKYTVFDEKTIAVFDYDIDRKILSAVTLSPNTFDITDKIDLTSDESSKLSMGRAEYKMAIDKFNEASSIYDINPVTSTPSGLIAGKLNLSVSEAVTAYVNAIRVAAGVPKVQIDNESFNVAQHKATLLSYRYWELGLDITHSPEQPSGVSDEFYDTAMGNGKGYAENVGVSGSSTNSKTIMNSINIFVDDSAEIPQLFSHRQKILSNEYKYFGYGISPNIFTNEFSGTNSEYENYLEAWPSNGITFMETLISPRFQWTAQFIDKYTILDTTTATIECLNTDEKWEFTEQENTTNRWFACHTNSVSSLNNKVVMYDSSIVAQPGYVYEITLHGIKENSTSKIVDYTYRSVFEYADVNNYPSQLNKLEITVPEGTSFVQDENENILYMLPIGEEINLGLEIDSDVVDKKVTWYSSNDKVKVTQNGIIYAEELLDEDEGNVTITVSYDGSNVTDEIMVKPYKKLNEVRLDKTDMECLALGENLSEPSFSLYIDYIPSDANEVKSVNWKIISKLNESIEYDIDDEYIRDYVRIEKDPSDPRRVYVYAVTAELNNSEYKIICEVEGISGTYTGECNLKINVPITSIGILPATIGMSISSSVLNINYNTYNNNTFALSTEIYPKNTTDDKTISWTIGDDSIISQNSTNVADATFNILKEGETTLTATSTNGKIDTITVRISSEITKLVLNSGTSVGYCNTVKGSNTAQLTVTKEPLIDADNIIYESNNNSIATVDSNGLVTFKNPGEVTISAYSEEKPSVRDEFKFNVYSLIDSIVFEDNSRITMNKGDTIQRKVLASPSNNSYNNRIQFSSRNPEVTIVDNAGNITGVGRGTAAIVAEIKGTYTTDGISKSVILTVEVKTPIESISLPDTRTMIKNQKTTLSVDITPEDTTSSYSVKWENLNPEILQLNESTGEVTALNLGNGTVRVTVTDKYTGKEFFDEVSINVVDYLKGDMDKNGAINSIDASILIDKYKSNEITDEDYAIGDMNNDNTLNSTDASIIIDLYKSNEVLN